MIAEVRVGRWQDTLVGSYDPARAIVVTDPPYGLKAADGSGFRAPGSHTGRLTGQRSEQLDKGYTDTVPWALHVAEVLEQLPAKRHVIRGPAAAIIRRDHPQPRRLCIEVASYRKRSMYRPFTVPYMWQAWVVYGNLRVGSHRSFPAGDALFTRDPRTDPRDHKPRSAHAAMTPFSVALWIVDTWADPGMVIIDPFAGTGAIGQAAMELGFDYLGAELIPEYARIAQTTIGIERMSLAL